MIKQCGGRLSPTERPLYKRQRLMFDVSILGFCRSMAVHKADPTEEDPLLSYRLYANNDIRNILIHFCPIILQIYSVLSI